MASSCMAVANHTMDLYVPLLAGVTSDSRAYANVKALGWPSNLHPNVAAATTVLRVFGLNVLGAGRSMIVDDSCIAPLVVITEDGPAVGLGRLGSGAESVFMSGDCMFVGAYSDAASVVTGRVPFYAAKTTAPHLQQFG